VTLVVLDDLTNHVPEKVETFWHSRGQIQLDGRSLSGTIIGRRAGLHFALASTVGLQAAVKSYPLERHARDHVIEMTSGVIGRAFTASVFSRREIAGPVEVAQSEAGVTVRTGETTLCFAMARNELTLKAVE